MKTLATYKVSLILDDENENIKKGYERMTNNGLSIEEINKGLTDEFFESLSELMEQESEDGLEIKVEQIEDLPF